MMMTMTKTKTIFLSLMIAILQTFIMIPLLHNNKIVLVVDAATSSHTRTSTITAGFLRPTSSIQQQERGILIKSQYGVNNASRSFGIRKKRLKNLQQYNHHHHHQQHQKSSKTTAYSTSSILTTDFDDSLSAGHVVQEEEDNHFQEEGDDHFQYLKGIQSPNELTRGYKAMEAYHDINYIKAEKEFVGSLRSAGNNWHWNTHKVAATNLHNMMIFYQKAFTMYHSGCFLNDNDTTNNKEQQKKYYHNIQRSYTVLVGLLSIAGYFDDDQNNNTNNNNNNWSSTSSSHDDDDHDDHHHLFDNNPETIIACKQILKLQYKQSTSSTTTTTTTQFEAWQCIVDAISSSKNIHEYHNKLFSYTNTTE